jgi:hypothetical protein
LRASSPQRRRGAERAEITQRKILFRLTSILSQREEEEFALRAQADKMSALRLAIAVSVKLFAVTNN